MSTRLRPIAFVLAAASHGTLIVNRNDYHREADGGYIGVGCQILNNSCYDPQDVELMLSLLRLKRGLAGDGVVALDCGANIGVHTVEWARAMHGWGRVIAFEAQERIFYALAGNLAINNCFNAQAHLAAVGAERGTIRVPVPDYLSPASFGSLELKPGLTNQFIGQEIDYSDAGTVSVNQLSIDSLNLPRVDFIKIDVEGMELDVLAGAKQTLTRFRPPLFIECLKTSKDQLVELLKAHGYVGFEVGINLLAVHPTDPLHSRVKVNNNRLQLV